MRERERFDLKECARIKLIASYRARGMINRRPSYPTLSPCNLVFSHKTNSSHDPYKPVCFCASVELNLKSAVYTHPSSLCATQTESMLAMSVVMLLWIG